MSAKRNRYIWQRATEWRYANERHVYPSGTVRVFQGPAVPTVWTNMPKAPPLRQRGDRSRFRRIEVR